MMIMFYFCIEFRKCQNFQSVANHYINENMNFVENNFPQKIILKIYILPGENCEDEPRTISEFENFKLNVFTILVTIINNIDIRFVPNKNLL